MSNKLFIAKNSEYDANNYDDLEWVEIESVVSIDIYPKVVFSDGYYCDCCGSFIVR